MIKTALLLGSTIFVGLTAVALPGQAQTSNPPSQTEPTAEGNSIPNDTRFECQISNGEYTVMYLPEDQPESAYPWATPSAMGGGWTAENRCFAISDRLESYRPEGLAELQVGTENGYDTVCATTEQFPGTCKIVFTVPPGQNPVVTRDLVFENLTLADSGTDTTVVNTYTGSGSNDLLGEIGSVIDGLPLPGRTPGRTPGQTPGQTHRATSGAINLKPFLAPADGGTGAALGNTTSSSRPLNPDRFR